MGITREELEAILKSSETDSTVLDNVNIQDVELEETLVQKANKEAASRRVANKELRFKIEELESAQKLAAEEKLKEAGKIQELLDIRTGEVTSLKEAKESLEKSLGEIKIKEEEKRLNILEKLPEDDQKILEHANIQIIEAFLEKNNQKPTEKNDAGAEGFTSSPTNTLNVEELNAEQVANLSGKGLTDYVKKFKSRGRKSRF